WSSTRGSISGGVSYPFSERLGPVGLSLPQLQRAKSASSKSHARLLQPQGAEVLAGALPMIRQLAAAFAPTVLLAGPAAAQQRLPDRAGIPERYRPFVGIWSDAVSTPQLCAALVVEAVQPDGTAAIVYVYGPIGSNNRRPGGVLHVTGIIRDGELRFQNSDGTQFAFRPLYADLDGRLTTAQGQSYPAVFKKPL